MEIDKLNKWVFLSLIVLKLKLCAFFIFLTWLGKVNISINKIFIIFYNHISVIIKLLIDYKFINNLINI